MRRGLLIVLLGVELALLGCERTDPKAVRIEGDSIGAVANWRAKIEDRFPPKQWVEVDAMLQELRWSVKPDNAAANADTTAEAVAKLVAGCTMDELLRLGYTAKLRRLSGVRAELKDSVDGNARMLGKDDASTTYLNQFRIEQKERLENVDADFNQARRRLLELGGRPDALTGVDTTPLDLKGTALSRADVMRQIDALIDRRRETAAMAYGAWPVTLDEDGTRLPDDQRDEFNRRKAAGAAAGRHVIAVRIRGAWHIFDEVPDLPQFPPAVLANLTPQDRDQIAAKWSRLQAELWARELNKAADEKPNR
jgi:hypothetical protein